MSEFDYNFELCFTDSFDASVLESANIPDAANQELQHHVQSVVSSLHTILKLQPGIRQMSTYTDFNSVRYRVTLTLSQ
jgi:hypothetical protein